MKICIGLTDVANVTANYAKGFRALGHEVFTAVWSKSRFYPDATYDIVIDDGAVQQKGVSKYFRMALQMLRIARVLKYDLFILYAPAVLPTHFYYPVLKLFRKRIVTAFWGSDVRYWYAFAEEMKSFGVQDEVSPFFAYAKERSGGSFFDKQRTITIAEKYSDLIISQPDCGQLQTQPYMRSTIPLDLSQFDFQIPGREKPLILHAPSAPQAKGTDVVLKTIGELREEGLHFDFQLIENMPNRELRLLLTKSDIVVDELYSATVAALSAEAMATGNVVLVRYMAEYCKVPDGCPAINVNIFTLKENLREMILNVEKRKELAALGRTYVEKANDHIKICRDMLDWLTQKDGLDYDFYPTFYQQFRLPDQILEEEKREHKSKRSDFFRMLLGSHR